MTPNQLRLIEILGLAPLPEEGGYYRETYRCTTEVDAVLPGDQHITTRVASTAIYYMITPDSFSALHRLKETEVFHFYDGGAVNLLLLHPDGRDETVVLGRDLAAGERPQVIVPAGIWQGLRLRHATDEWALLGTTVAPGFEFRDFELGDRRALRVAYPQAAELISTYTRPGSEAAPVLAKAKA